MFCSLAQCVDFRDRHILLGHKYFLDGLADVASFVFRCWLPKNFVADWRSDVLLGGAPLRLGNKWFCDNFERIVLVFGIAI